MVVFNLFLTSALLIYFLSVISSSFFLSPNRYSSSLRIVLSSLISLNSGLYSGLFTSVLVSFLVVNLSGNIPGLSIPSIFYYFSCSVSLTLWVSLICVVVVTQLNSFIAHILPYGSPVGLMLLLPLIEIFSQLIRPFTLIIRLSTNLSSGHIIMYIFSFFSVSSLVLTVSLTVVLGLLFILELIISCLQAYIFSSLVYLYISETF